MYGSLWRLWWIWMKMTRLIIVFFQVALTGAPASSHIFVFTDAIAKDIALKDTIVALIRSSKSIVNTDWQPVMPYVHSVYWSQFNLKGWGYNLNIKLTPQVSFYMTEASSRRRRSLRAASFEDYKDLALASGGQAIQVSKKQLPQATDVILDTSTSALVRLCTSNSVFCTNWSVYQEVSAAVPSDCRAAFLGHWDSPSSVLHH